MPCRCACMHCRPSLLHLARTHTAPCPLLPSSHALPGRQPTCWTIVLLPSSHALPGRQPTCWTIVLLPSSHALTAWQAAYMLNNRPTSKFSCTHCLAGGLHAEQSSHFPVRMHCLAGSLHAEQSSYFLVLMHSLPGRRPTCWTVILALCWALLLVNQSTLVLSTSMSNAQMMRRVGRTMYTWCKYSIFGREITK